jgi:environmental stress-induced protein Ves
MGADRTPDHLGVVRFADLTPVPWRNGGGVTRELVSAGGSGLQGFDWRISIAEVNQAGPFSTFPGVDRIITVVEGEGMDLVIDGVEHVLGLHEPLSFDGASRTECSRLAGPVRDLNVMTRNDRLSATVAIRDLSETRPIAIGASQVLVLLTGSAVVVGADGSRATLSLLDAVCPSAEHVRLVEGSGRAAVVRIEEHHQARARRSESRVGEAPATTVQITFDCADPQALAQFWQVALRYVPQPPPQGHETWESWLAAMGVPQSEWNDGASICPPEGTGPTLYFQKVPEPKTVKNRLHLDLDIAFSSDPIAARMADIEAEVVRLTALGATVIGRVTDHDHFHVTMGDPEGNEFDLR